MDEAEFAPEEIKDFSLKDGGDDADVVDPVIDDVVDPLEDPNEDKFSKAFAKDDDEVYAGEDTSDASDIVEYILNEQYEDQY